MSILRWGVLSTAKIAREKVIPAIRTADRCAVVAIGSRDGARATGVAKAHGIPNVHASYEGVLEDPDVDAVYIPLPNHLHAEWTVAAARAGKHVLCEKPIALDVAEAEWMVEVCAEHGVRLMEAFMYRLHPSWVAVREIVDSGRIGRLSAVQSWFSYFNDDPTNLRNVRAFGGGALMDIGCYSVNLSRMLFGTEPDRIEATVTRDASSGVDVLTSAMLGFGGRVATFTCSTRVEPDQRVHVYGTEGRVSVAIPFNIPSDRPTQISVTAGGDPPVAPDTEVLTFDPADAYAVQAAAFASAVLDGTPVPIPPEDAIANMRVIDAIVAAGRA